MLFRQLVEDLKKSEREVICDLLFRTKYGKLRREKLLNIWPEQGVVVNREYCVVLRHDIDLQYLIKKGKLKLKRVAQSGRTSYNYLVKVV